MTKNDIREIEQKSILDFLQQNKEYLAGKVLDFGCGDMPYKDLISGEYHPYDLNIGKIETSYDSILCTQVIEYIKDPEELFKKFYRILKHGGHLIITYPTHWEEVESNDIWRLTKSGMEMLLRESGFEILKHEARAKIDFEDFYLAIGYGVVCKKL